MKRNLLVGASCVLIAVSVACGQYVAEDSAAVVARGDYVPSAYNTAFGPSTCQSDCQINWGMYRNGALWENYCAEKRPCYDPHSRRAVICPDGGHDGLLDLLPIRRSVTCGGNLAAIRSKCRRDRILSFNIFCDLLGWRDCQCSAGACCDNHGCSAGCPVHDPDAAPTTEPMDQDLPPTPEPSDDHQQHARDDVMLSEPPPAFPVEGTPVRPDVLSEPGAAVRRSEPAKEVPRDEPSGPILPGVEVPALDTPLPPAPAPKKKPQVPRNILPKTEPASPTSRRSVIKVLVAERLSDYIKT